MSSRYVVGIDLGTTNSAVGYVDTHAEDPRIESLPIAQLVEAGKVADRPALPSFLYLSGEHDVRPGELALPWDADQNFAAGEFAREQGARVSGRLVSSAKSWLCHGGVDRQADILPWGAPDDVRRISPVEASSRFLQHLRAAWLHRFPNDPLDDQDVILTVPASFDEVARELTIEAAARAELHHARLLEEPQAAFYAWLERHPDAWREHLVDRRLALVVDVGGGTSDFSLIHISGEDDAVGLQRLAVGDHILLGGDNVDVALARVLEDRFGEKLDSQRWHALTNLCRAAKERLLGEDAPQSETIRLGGRGRSLVGGTLSASLTRDEVERLVIDGFFPLVDSASAPAVDVRGALQEWGLPYAGDAALTRHLAAFLRHHSADPIPGRAETLGVPDAVLFNGGALKPPIIRARLLEQLSQWAGGSAPAVLDTGSLDLAVSRGAAYYGLVRRGRGVRIGGGSPRAYYLGVAAGQAESSGEQPAQRVLCLVHRGMAEGTEVELAEPELAVTTNQPCSFPLFASSTRIGDEPGALVDAPRESLNALPPVRTVLRFGKKLTRRDIPVHVLARLTDIGTMEVWLRSTTTDHRWRLNFRLRDLSTEVEIDDGAAARATLELPPEQVDALQRELRAVFPLDGSAGGDPVVLTRRMEDACGTGKDAWPLDTIRTLWDELWQRRELRKHSAAHEARWLNLCGFLLRPGYGHGTDDWRLQQLWRLYSEGLSFPRAVQGRVEWWNLWKRIAGGLNRPQQEELHKQVAPYLLPRLKSKRKERSAVGPQEIREYWQLVASCEQLAASAKTELGAVLVAAAQRGKATDAELWALGRLGARAPLNGPLNAVVARAEVEKWVAALLAGEWARPQSTVFALVQLARCVNDRERDLDGDLRRRLAERLRALPGGSRAAQLVSEFVPLEAEERARILDESLPVGILLRGEGRGARG